MLHFTKRFLKINKRIFKGANSMWTVVHIAQNKIEADKVEKALVDQGVLVKVRQLGKSKNDQALYEILVPQAEVEDACLVLTSITY
jgi:hypothetical protein